MITFKSVRLLSLSLAVAGFFPSLSSAQDSKVDPTQPPSKEDSPTNIAQLDAVKGFGGLAFGSDFSAAKGLEIEQDRGSLKIYKKFDGGEAKVPLALGPVLLETILYYYFEGKLYGIAFHTNDGQDTLNLKRVFATSFGAGQDSDDSGPSTIWIGKKNGALFELNTSTGDGSAFLFDIKLHDAFLKYESEAVQKAAAQLIKGE
ncbi:MAG: hypothetical protein ACOYMS_09975 [Terrimicrobiaceae bacterium]